MRNALLRTLLLFPLLLGLAACDSGESGDDGPNTGNNGGNSNGGNNNGGQNNGGNNNGGAQVGIGAVTLSGALQGAFSGTSIAGVDEDDNFAIYVQDGSAEGAASRGVLLYRVGAEAPAAGRTYPVGDPDTGAFAALYFEYQTNGAVLVEALAGQLTVATVTGTEFAGQFQFSGSALHVTSENGNGEALGSAAVSGQFRALFVQERAMSDASVR